MADYYSLLNVTAQSSEKDIRKAYRKLAKTCHPDLYPGDKRREEYFRNITTAYAILSDPKTRQEYDLKRSPPAAPKTYSYHEVFRQMNEIYPAEEKFNFHDWLTGIFASPLLYCALFAILLLVGFKELVQGLAGHK